jgi:hypothetical protein
MQELAPLEMLDAMHKYWHLTGCQQDTQVFCLEVQQLYLYLHLHHDLLRWYRMLPNMKQVHDMQPKHKRDLWLLRQQILYGADFNKNADLSRVFFIEILVRRLLFWACLNYLRRYHD